MQNALRKWLVGIGLMVALLALAVPAVAQNNEWLQSTPNPTFPTPVQALAFTPTLGGVGQLDVGTSGGTYPSGGVLGNHFWDGGPAPFGDAFSGPDATPAPAATDLRAILWENTGAVDYGFFGTADSQGLYQYTNPGPGWTHPSYSGAVPVAGVNQSVNCLAFDTANPVGPGGHHVLYVGSLGSGIYKYDGATWTNLTQATWPVPGAGIAYPEGYISKLVVFKVTTTTYIFATTQGGDATDAGYILRGRSTNNGATWSWDKVGTSLPNFGNAFGLAYTGSSLLVGTAADGIWASSNPTAGTPSFSAMSAPATINTRVTDILFGAAPNFVFAATDGQGVYRWDDTRAEWFPISLGPGNECAAGTHLVDQKVLVLAWDQATFTLWAGTSTATVGGSGNVWRITFAPMAPVPGTFSRTVLDGFGPDTITMGPVAVCNPWPWTAMVTAGSLPDGMSLTATYDSPIVNLAITGEPTRIYCSLTSTVTVWDALGNRTDNPITYMVAPKLGLSHVPLNPIDPGTTTTFTLTFDPGVGQSINWTFDFGDGSPLGTGTQVGPGSLNIDHMYLGTPAADPSLFATPTACPTAAVFPCAAVIPDACIADPLTVSGPFYVSPWARNTSGNEFRFDALIVGGCLPYTINFDYGDGTSSGDLVWTVYPAPLMSLPTHIYPGTGTWHVVATVTDCKGFKVQGSSTLNWNGALAGSVTSDLNPAPENTPVTFNVSGTTTSSVTPGIAFIQYDFDGDGVVDLIHGVPVGPMTFFQDFGNYASGYVIRLRVVAT